MNIIYLVLGIFSILLFGMGFFVGKLERKYAEANHSILNTSTIPIEILMDEEEASFSEEEPIIISSTLLEENLEMYDEEI